MKLTDDEKEWVKLIAAEVSRAIIEQVVEVHIKCCPHAQIANKRWYLLLGVVSGVSGGAGFGISQLIGA